MSSNRHTTPVDRLVIDEAVLDEIILAGMNEGFTEADAGAALIGVADNDQDIATAGDDLETPVLDGALTASSDASPARYDDMHILSVDNSGSISIASVPLHEVSPSGLLGDEQGSSDSSLPVFTASLEQIWQVPVNDLTFLDYQPLAKPDHAGGGGGGGKDKPGKGGGKPDKNDDSGDGGDPPSEPGVLDSYVSGDSGGYNIQIYFNGTWTVQLQTAFIDAADLISSLITADIADVSYNGSILDDIIITAELTAIDGTGGILGQAGPTAIRTVGKLPALAQMQFDSADADYYDGIGLWNDIVIHEMLHSVGVGTIWSNLNLISGNGTNDPLFTGEFANMAYDDLFADLNALSDLIPIEADGGPGTAYGHWDETTFGNELMTGYINGANYISAMTVASLEDMGYATTWDASAPGDTGIGAIIV